MLSFKKTVKINDTTNNTSQAVLEDKMAVETHTLEYITKGKAEIINITSDVDAVLKKSKLTNGIIIIFVPGSTAALTTMEFESGLVKDFIRLWDKFIPEAVEYSHNIKWHDNNGHSHLRSSLLGPSLTVPFTNKILLLGNYQQIVLVDFDNRGREREIVCQILGE